MIRLLQITPYGTGTLGGVGHVSYQLAQWLGTHPDEISVQWAAHDTVPSSLPNVSFLKMDPLLTWKGKGFYSLDLWSIRSMRTLFAHIRSSDIVQFHDIMHVGCLAAFCWATFWGVPTVFTQHSPMMKRRILGGVMSYIRRILLWFILSHATSVVYVAQHLQEENAPLLQRPSHIILCGIDPSVFHQNDTHTDDPASTIDLNPLRPNLLFIGRFTLHKRLHLLHALAAQHQEWNWILIGEGEIDPRTWNLPNVRVISPCDHKTLARYYHAADMLVLPTYGEGFSLAMLEALSCGLPVAISSIAHPEDHISKNLYVSVHDTNDDASSIAVWSTALQEALQPQHMDAMRSSLRAHPLDLTWEKMAAAYLALYRSMARR